MEIPKQGEKYLHFKGHEYEIVKIENKEVIYKLLEAHDGYKEGEIFPRSLEDFCGEKVFEKDKTIDGKEYKKGDKIKRFVKL